MATKKKLADDLRPASFRGIAFKVENTELSAGRRTQVHEYPQRDKPYVEDLGRATRDLTFSGFVVGEDYVKQANELLGALEEAGPGTLIHPWFGTLKVTLKDPARVAFDAGLGVARFSMSFVEAGEMAFPSSEESTQAASRLAASNLETVAVQSFTDQFDIKGFQDFVSAAANGALGDMLGIVSSSEIGKILGFANSLAKTVATAISFISNPASLGWMLVGAFGLSGIATTFAAWSSIVRSLCRIGGSKSLSKSSATGYTPSRQQAITNTNAVNALCRRALIAQAVGASSLVGTALDANARPAVAHADMMAIRNDLVAVIDQECLTADDAAFVALMQARHAVWKDLTTRARDSARLDTLTPNEVLPALVLAYDYYEDAARDSDIVSRNAIRHPGFVPVIPLKVLTR